MEFVLLVIIYYWFFVVRLIWIISLMNQRSQFTVNLRRTTLVEVGKLFWDRLYVSVAFENDKLKLLSADGGNIREVTKPFSTLQVSSNTSDLHNLTDEGAASFWQSSGSARTHWIRLNMKPNVILQLLSINVASNDQSYMPKDIVISVGKGDAMREFKEVRIPRYKSTNSCLSRWFGTCCESLCSRT